MDHQTFNPLLPLHEHADAETQFYADVQIVSTFGQMPAEYAAIHTACALMDLPQRGLIELTGRDRLSFLNNLITCGIWDKSSKSGLTIGQGAYGFLLNLKGRIVADLHVIECGERTLVEADGRLLQAITQIFEKYHFAEQVKIQPLAGTMHQLLLMGPNAWPILRQAVAAEINIPGSASAAIEPLPETLPAQEYSIVTRLFGREVILWRLDQTPQPGIRLIMSTADASVVWTGLMAAFGQPDEHGRHVLRPCGWAAFNACRVESGLPLEGIDFDENTLPAETGLMDRAVSFTKGCYLGQEIVARMHARNQVARQIIGLRIAEDAVPIAGEKVFTSDGQEIGAITSSTLSPRMSNAAIALAIVRKPHFALGTPVQVPAEGKMRSATVVPLPFFGDKLPLPGISERKPADLPVPASNTAIEPDPTNAPETP